MMRTAILLSISALLVSGCSLVQRSDDSSAGGSPPESMIPPGATGKPSIDPTAERIVSGTLGFESIEGGCPYLAVDDGTRYQVIYPEGWRLDSSSGALTGPDGQSYRPGTSISVRGSIDNGMSSTCQIGPFLRASEVLSASAT